MDTKVPTLAIGLPYFLSDKTDKEYSHLHTMMTIPSIAGEMIDYILQLAKNGLFFFIIDDEAVKRIISPLYNKLIGFTNLTAIEVARTDNRFCGKVVKYPQLPCVAIKHQSDPPSTGTFIRYYPMDNICVLGDYYRYTDDETKWNYEKVRTCMGTTDVSEYANQPRKQISIYSVNHTSDMGMAASTHKLCIEAIEAAANH